MMSKKTIITAVTVLSVFASALPVYAQQYQAPQQGGGGFFSGIANFFNAMFHRNQQPGSGQMIYQNQQNGVEPSGTVPLVSGLPDRLIMDQMRLQGLVKAGKITQAQATAILAELEKVQNELKAWADSQGINEAYVLGGGLGPGTGQGGPGGQGQGGMMQGGQSGPQGGYGGPNQGQQQVHYPQQ